MSAPNEDQIQLGRQRAKEFFGEKHSSELAGQAVQKPDIFKKTAQDFVMGVCFTGYDRAGLTFRERSIMNIAMLIALNRGNELRIHLRGAFHNGMTEEAVCEACRHAMVYCGVPAGRDALLIASSVAAELKEAGVLS